MPRIGAAEAEFAGSIPDRAGAVSPPPEWPPCHGRAARKMRVRRGQAATSSGLDFSNLLINNDLDRLGRYAVAAGHLLGSRLEPGTRDSILKSRSPSPTEPPPPPLLRGLLLGREHTRFQAANGA